MDIKKLIEAEAYTYTFGNCNDRRTFLAGSDFAIKAVIEMLEERKKEMEDIHEWDASDEDDYIINLLKSER